MPSHLSVPSTDSTAKFQIILCHRFEISKFLVRYPRIHVNESFTSGANCITLGKETSKTPYMLLPFNSLPSNIITYIYLIQTTLS